MQPDNVQPESGRSEARRRAILDVARDVFLAEGYAAASMSEIAQRLGGSKGTLYNYFRSKEELFVAFMNDTCLGPANAIFEHLPPIGADIRVALVDLGVGLLEFILSNPVMAVHRLVVAESERFPELGRIFYETGPRKGESRLGDYMQGAMDAGFLRPRDPVSTGRWFKDLLLADIYNRRLWGVIDDQNSAQIRAHVEEAVDIFLAAFAAPI